MPRDAAGTGRSGKSKPAKRDRHAPRPRRHGIVRPTASGWFVLALGGLCCFLALLLDDRMLSAATLALWAAPLMSLLIAVAQRRFVTADLARAVIAGSQLPQTRDGSVAYVPVRGWRRLVLPHSMAAALQWEQIDQYGRVVRRGAGRLPDERGLYRHVGFAATWSDPFGLIRQRRMLPDDGETMVLPAESDGFSEPSLAADARLQDQSAGEMASSVRQYAPGDSPRLISWRHTAHRGELMTRESDRDVHVTTLLVIDLDADLDAAAAYALQRLRGTQGKGLQVVVSDGESFHVERGSAARFLAAMRPWTPESRTEPRTPESKEPASPERPSVAGQVTAIAGFAAAQHQPLRIVLVAADAHTPLSAALESSPLGTKTSVHVVGPARNDRDDAERQPIPCIAVESAAPGSKPGSGPSASRPVAADEPWRHPWRRHLAWSRCLTVAALIVLHVVTLLALEPMIELKGLWPFTSLALLIVATVEAVAFPPATAWRSARRVLVGSAAILLVALLAMAVRIHEINGMWLIGRHVETMTDADGQVAEQVVWNFDLLPDALNAGMNELYVQLPPLTVGPYADVLLIGAGALVAILLRCVLVQPVAAPALAAVPVAVMATAFAFVGQTPSYTMIGVTVCAALVLLWATVPVRALAPMPLVASGVVTAIVLALTPAATGVAIAVPLAVGTPGGLFSTSTINPMVDLKRGLNTGSTANVFSYTSYAGRPYYFRMATLDDFNGDTWKYDPQLASDGGLYGGLPNFGVSPQSDPLRTGDNWNDWYGRIRDLTPLQRVMLLSSTTSQDVDYDADDLTTINGMYGTTDVYIESLASRFLPVAGESAGVSGLDNESWYRADDGTIFSTDTLTSRSMFYGTYGTTIAPISDAAGFEQISATDRVRQAYLAYSSSGAGSASVTEARRESTRRALASSGYGTIEGRYLVIPLRAQPVNGAGVYDYGDGGDGYDPSGSMVTLVDAQGNAVTNDQIPLDYLDGVSVSFNKAFRDRIALNESESYLMTYGMGVNRTSAVMVVRLDGSAITDDGNDDSNAASDEFVQAARDYGMPVLSYHLTSAAASYGGSAYYNRNRPRITANDLADDGTGVSLRSRYGNLPAELPEHVQAVVDEAKAAGVPSDGMTEDAQVKAMRWLVDYFNQPGFVYSLAQPDGNGRNNLEVVDDFLVDKSGYCTHYATALAVLARAMGLSTRIVLGYNRNAPGDAASSWSSGSDSGTASTDRARYDVQAKQLHSWTEVYIDNMGWVPFDVTPSADGTDTLSGGDDNGVNTIAPSAGASSSSASASASASETTSTEDETSSATDDAASQDNAAGNAGTVVTRRFELPGWVVATLWILFGLALAAALALTPYGLRERRRRLRLRVIDQAIAVGDDDALNRRAWREAWREATDCARDAGMSWPATATDGDVTQTIGERFSDERPRLDALADQAIASAYGGPEPPVRPLDAAVPQTLGSMRSRITGLRRFLPRSLFR